MLPRSRQDLLGAMALAALVALSGCSDGGAPSAPQAPKPVQPPVAQPAAPPPPAGQAGPVYTYETKNRRDPFRPLITPRVVEVATPRSKCQPGQLGLGCVDVRELKLAGVVWGSRGYHALIEAPNGAGYVVRVDDTVGGDARVSKITPEAITFEVKSGAGTQSQMRAVELRLRKEE